MLITALKRCQFIAIHASKVLIFKHKDFVPCRFIVGHALMREKYVLNYLYQPKEVALAKEGGWILRFLKAYKTALAECATDSMLVKESAVFKH